MKADENVEISSCQKQSVVNFTNTLRAAFTRADLNSEKKSEDVNLFFAVLGSACVKAGCKV